MYALERFAQLGFFKLSPRTRRATILAIPCLPSPCQALLPPCCRDPVLVIVPFRSKLHSSTHLPSRTLELAFAASRLPVAPRLPPAPSCPSLPCFLSHPLVLQSTKSHTPRALRSSKPGTSPLPLSLVSAVCQSALALSPPDARHVEESLRALPLSTLLIVLRWPQAPRLWLPRQHSNSTLALQLISLVSPPVATRPA